MVWLVAWEATLWLLFRPNGMPFWRVVLFASFFAPMGAAAMYLVGWRLFGGMLAVLPVVGSLYRGVDALLHGADVASAYARASEAGSIAVEAHGARRMSLYSQVRGRLVLDSEVYRAMVDPSDPRTAIPGLEERGGKTYFRGSILRQSVDPQTIELLHGNTFAIDLGGEQIAVARIDHDRRIVTVGGGVVGQFDETGLFFLLGRTASSGGFTGSQSSSPMAPQLALAERRRELASHARRAVDAQRLGDVPGRIYSAAELAAGEAVREKLEAELGDES